MSAPRSEPASRMTLIGWGTCLAVSWLTIQTVSLAVQVLQ